MQSQCLIGSSFTSD